MPYVTADHCQFLPGDGSLTAIRADHDKDIRAIETARGSLVNPFLFCQVAVLLHIIDVYEIHMRRARRNAAIGLAAGLGALAGALFNFAWNIWRAYH